ncbi:hypothetical protein VNG_0926H [Halobacterium salinarum NRC-1]|uniref:Spurious ORF n=1 Tax=Halobacterium salinarum (strain ATCC 700922 / JCM 11081 / NRC-1) TaxID=64091 RepID=Q9HR02_HALSA|nr:hypothetical protein VNG_0926H [Halobacterium salinarum NRC-1]WJK64706.1 hypothetical protein QSJ49_06035 [Halobacterium salinarum]DAC78063.1 TPA_inf: spurious ORF [Halobacterium salinarum NRC-1]
MLSVSQKSSVTSTTNSRSRSKPCWRAFSKYDRMHSYSRIVGTITQMSWVIYWQPLFRLA